MRIDSHIHTERCGHGRGSAREYLQAAEARGVDVLVFTEHVPLPHDLDPDREYAMAPEEWPTYTEEIRALTSESVTVLLGAEADWLPGRMEHVTSFLSTAAWDVVLGSVHMLDEWTFDDPEKISTWDTRDVDDVWERYFAAFCDAVRSGIFDVMAHPDLVKKFGHTPSLDPGPWYRQAARTLAEESTAIEVSTAGLYKPCQELYPSDDFLRACSAEGVFATTGSDAHCPQDVGRDLDVAVEALERCGFDHVVYFRNRVPVVVRL